jgi:hypothetical protein
MAINDLITFRKGTASAWTSANPVLASGEPGYDLTNSVLKIGDGVSNWVSLSGIGSSSVGGSSSSYVGVRGIISTTGTLTSFAVSGGYPVGYLDLFQDGVKLVSTLDFSATDGSNVTLSNSVPSGTVLEYLTMASGVSSGLSWSSVPASATAAGTAGSIAYDALGNFYICTATNTWVRSSLAAWETDASFASVSLLLNMEGSGSTFADYSSSPKTITAYHGATQSAALPKFGTKSLYLNGTTFGAGPYLSVPYSSAFDLSSGDWTVECWAYATALNASNNLFAINGDGASNAQVTVVPQANGSAYFLTQGSSGDWLDTTLAAAGTFTTNTWQHVAAVRAGNVFRLYVNGTSVVSFTSSSALMNASGLSTVGARLPAGNSTVGSQTWQGYIDDFRVTKGVARYSGATLTVPTAASLTS